MSIKNFLTLLIELNHVIFLTGNGAELLTPENRIVDAPGVLPIGPPCSCLSSWHLCLLFRDQMFPHNSLKSPYHILVPQAVDKGV